MLELSLLKQMNGIVYPFFSDIYHEQSSKYEEKWPTKQTSGSTSTTETSWFSKGSLG